MKINDKCLPCLVNQVVRVADMTEAKDKETLYKRIFSYLGNLSFTETNPEIFGQTFAFLKEHIKNDDPYRDVRNYYNNLFLDKLRVFEKRIENSGDSFISAARHAAIGNIIDFNPVHNTSLDDIMETFEKMSEVPFTLDDTVRLRAEIISGNRLLYLGDNCGEICLDKLFIKEIKNLNPDIEIHFATRGTSVVNDSIEEDAYTVGINEYATIISNGDNSQGTVLKRTSKEFMEVYNGADIIIAKGQANYESLSEERGNIYFTLITKCEVIADDIGVPKGSIVLFGKTK